MDLVIPEGVQDLKTGAKVKTQSDIDGDVQFSVYAALHVQKYGKLPGKIIIDNIVDRAGKTKTTTEYVQFTTTRGPEVFDALARRINTVTRGIEAGMFMPATPGAWWCSAKSCGYYRTCGYCAKTSQTESEE